MRRRGDRYCLLVHFLVLNSNLACIVSGERLDPVLESCLILGEYCAYIQIIECRQRRILVRDDCLDADKEPFGFAPILSRRCITKRIVSALGSMSRTLGVFFNPSIRLLHPRNPLATKPLSPLINRIAPLSSYSAISYSTVY